MCTEAKNMDYIKFKINGTPFSVGCEVTSQTMLLDYIRNCLELRGTKYMCREGGCGACIVVVTKPGGCSFAVNSCLVSITSCQGWDITTIEGLGNRKKGYNILQSTLAENDGTQCGYCSPGWVMAMHGLRKSNKDLSMLEIEKSFGSNVCRCTGYRPILKAFKKFAKDAPPSEQIHDIEDLHICDNSSKNCDRTCDAEWCMVNDGDVEDNKRIKILLKDDKIWYKVYKLEDIFEIFRNEGLDSYMLVFGNTAKGVYPIEEYPERMIDITEVNELKANEVDQNVIVGGGITLTDFLCILQERAQSDGFRYLRKMYDHIMKIAHIPVRNIGSIAGNLMIKHAHNEFPSDLYLLFETVGAQLTIAYNQTENRTVTLDEFLSLDMNGKVIVNVLLRPLSDEYKLETFKVMPRSQNASAIVNAGFLYQQIEGIVQSCRIVYGGLSPDFIKATETETYLLGKCLFKNEVLQGAIKVLNAEMVVEDKLPQMSVEYRRYLAKALFYKSLLTIYPSPRQLGRYASGATEIHDQRPVSQGIQKFDTNQSLWPLNQPINKVDGLIQCAGEALYTEDIPAFPREVFAAFVLSTVGGGNIVRINPRQALNEPGVIAFYSAKDIPGLNSFTPADSFFYIANEEVLCNGTVKYFNQPIGIIVAETQYIANKAARLVQASYENVTTPVLDIKEAKKDPNRNTITLDVQASSTGDDVARVISGSNTIYAQVHYTMETIVCVVKPTEEGLAVYCATQWTDGTQLMIARALGIDVNSVDVHVRRVGGAYGLKVSRSIQSAVACSLVVSKLNRPCRFIHPFTTTTRAVGKRFPCSSDFEVGVNNNGVIQYNNYNFYADNGYQINESLILVSNSILNNCYDWSRWTLKSYNTVTDTASNSFCRAPGTIEALAMAEKLMERIAYEMALDPIEVRIANLDKNHLIVKDMIESLSSKSDYIVRKIEVDTFNSQNRWKKRGLRFSVARWIPAGFQRFDVNMSVFHGDGSIVITHAAIELGQGTNTKAIQICAYLLNVPIDKIKVKENNTTIAPNSTATAGSLGTQNVAIGVRKCCEILLERLQPIRQQLENATWEELIKAAFNADVDLQIHSFVGARDIQEYNVYGVALCEVEVDILTGEYEILRTDIIQDVGLSISPRIDVGQVEGGFVMAMGYWTSERLVYEDTGELLTDRTWNYHVPNARDIPQDFRIHFLKNSYSNALILGAKGTGEPAANLAISVTFALRAAISSAKLEAGIPTTEWIQIDGPWTVERVCLAAKTSTDDFKFC